MEPLPPLPSSKKNVRALIAGLPSGIGVSKSTSGRGRVFVRVRLGERFTGGPVLKKDFSSVDGARKWIFGDAQEHRANPGAMLDLKAIAGASAFTLSASQLAEAEAAFRACGKAGISLTEAVRFAVRHASPPAGTISVLEAITKALEMKTKSRRPLYVQDLGKRWRRFEGWLPAERRKALNGITKLDVRNFLNACGLKSVGERNMLRNLSVLFAWAVDQHHMADNPCLGIKVTESTTKRAGVRILSIGELRKMIDLVANGFEVAAEEHEKDAWRKKYRRTVFRISAMEMAPILCVGCFGGVRPEESVRMTWEMVDFERKHLDLPGEITKDGERRIVDMSDNLVTSLLACRKESGPLSPDDFRRKRWMLCKAMGWASWPADILRHSFGSYHLAKHRNAALTAELMGHRNARMLYTYYREVVKENADVEEYWVIALKRNNAKCP